MRPAAVLPRSAVVAFIVGALLVLAAVVAAPFASVGAATSAAPVARTVAVVSDAHPPVLAVGSADGAERQGVPADGCVLPCAPVCAGPDVDCVPSLAQSIASVGAIPVRDATGQGAPRAALLPGVRGHDRATPSLTLLSIRRI